MEKGYRFSIDNHTHCTHQAKTAILITEVPLTPAPFFNQSSRI
jgi:hypothetical protein